MNILFTIIGEPFKQYILEQCRLRNEKVMEQRKMLIKVDPEIAAAFDRCNHVSVSIVNVCLTLYSFYRLTEVQAVCCSSVGPNEDEA